MKRLPIRWKFALWAAGLAGFVLLVFAGGTFLNLYREQVEAVDLVLNEEVRQLTSIQDDAVLRRTLDDLLHFQPGLAVAMFDEQGHIARLSAGLTEHLARAALSEAHSHTARSDTGDTWRLRVFRRGDATWVIAHALREVNEIVRDLLFSYLLSLPIVLVVAAVGGWWVAGRALAPLRELTTAAETIRAGHLDRRMPAAPADDEIRRLADVVNAMLGRLEQSFEQAQRFAADASHELRTPLTIMHGEIERLLRTPALDPAHEEKLISLQEEIGRLDRITEHLLLLARFDTGKVEMRSERVDFSALVGAVCEDAELLAEAHDIELSTAIAPGVGLKGDDAHLRRAVLTLLDNAVRYNQPRGKVDCALELHAAGVRLRVRNTGPGIRASDREQVFQRFFRADAARSRGGHGLGLSLAREIAHAHGGNLELAPDEADGWTEFALTLPRLA